MYGRTRTGCGKAVALASGYAGEMRRGFLVVAPLWLGVLPFGVAFALLSKAAGFGLLETQAFSALVFAGSAQVAAATLIAEGAGALAVVLTALMLNLRHVLYGVSLDGELPEPSRPPRAVLAFLLIDEVYGVAVKEQFEGRDARFRDAFMLGAGLSLYVSFNLSTVTGALLGSTLPDTDRLGLDFIFPLMFLVLLIPLLRPQGAARGIISGVAGRRVLIALVAGALALLLSRIVPAGATVLVGTLAAAGLGAGLDRGAPTPESDAREQT